MNMKSSRIPHVIVIVFFFGMEVVMKTTQGAVGDSHGQFNSNDADIHGVGSRRSWDDQPLTFMVTSRSSKLSGGPPGVTLCDCDSSCHVAHSEAMSFNDAISAIVG